MKNSFLFIKRNIIARYLLVAVFLLFIISSTRNVFETPTLKLLFDETRIVLLTCFFLISVRAIKINFIGIVFLGIAIIKVTFDGDLFIGQLVVGIFISRLLFDLERNEVIASLVSWSTIAIVTVIFFVKIGFIESKIGFNPIAASTILAIEHKEDWGFWHPNIISSLLAGCMVASFYIGNRKFFALSIIAYLVVLTGTVSRTFLFIPIILIIFFAIESRGYLSSKLSLLFALSLGLVSSFLSFLFVFPALLKSFLSERFYQTIDGVVSHRLDISYRLIQGVDFFEYFSGLHQIKLEVDSLFVNFALSQGGIVYVLFLMFLIYSMFLAFKKKMTKELLVISLFMLISNFEDVTGISSLFFVVFCICLFYIFNKKSTNYRLNY